jgi:hypothetical protein
LKLSLRYQEGIILPILDSRCGSLQELKLNARHALEHRVQFVCVAGAGHGLGELHGTNAGLKIVLP